MTLVPLTDSRPEMHLRREQSEQAVVFFAIEVQHNLKQDTVT